MRFGLFGRNRGIGGRPRARMSWKMRLIPLMLFAIYGLYFYVSKQETVPLTGRSQLVYMTHEQEMALGLQSYQEILSQSRVIPEGQVVDLVRTIGRRLAHAAADVDPGFEWEFNVIDSQQANAFALPGGKTAVYTGLIPVAKNQNGLAIARHGAERMAHQKLVQMGSIAATVAVGDMDYDTQRMVMGALGVGEQYGVLPPLFP